MVYCNVRRKITVASRYLQNNTIHKSIINSLFTSILSVDRLKYSNKNRHVLKILEELQAMALQGSSHIVDMIVDKYIHGQTRQEFPLMERITKL